MSKKKATILGIILGVIALLEIGGAVALLFYGNELKAKEAELNRPSNVVTTTPGVTGTPAPTNAPVTTNTPKPTNTLEPANTPNPTDTAAPTNTLVPAVTKIPDISSTPAPSDPPIYTSVPTDAPDEPVNNPTGTPKPTDTKAPTKTPSPTPTKAPSPTPTKTPTKTPTPTVKPTSGAASDTVVAPSSSGRLHVEGTSIVDENGKAVQLKGISTAGLQWFPQYVDQKAFHQFRYEWGVNIMRLAMYTDEGGYCAGSDKTKMKALIDKGVQYAKAEDMYVIIDWHILHDNDPNKYKSEALKFFEEMSLKYKDYNNVIYEICNEPNGGTSWKQIKSYALEVIKVIRKNDPNAIIIVGTPTWSQEVDKAAADPITGYDNIMYTLHFYADTHKDGLRNTMEQAIKKGLPVFVTEYGITDASGNGACNETEANKWMALMDKYGVSSCIWNLANKNESSCLLVSTCKKTNGFTQSDLSQEGKWFYKIVTSGNGGMIGEVPDYSAVDDDNNNGGGSGGDNSGGNSGGNNSSGTNEKAGTEYVITQGNLQVTLKVSGAWGGEKCKYQYAVSVKNVGTTAVSGWSVTIDFASEASMGNFWCCKCSASGKQVTISNESWNGAIQAGATVSDIGVEVYGDEKQKPVN